MATFNLAWNNAGIVSNTNVTAQRAHYRQKSVGGVYITTGFIPANDLPTSATATSIAGLLDNIVYEFRIAAICTAGGPTYNDNGIQEKIHFACVTPTASNSTDTSISINVASLPNDITKVVFRLYDSTGTSLLQGPISINHTASTTVTNIFTGLTASTSYVVKVELVALVQSVEVVSTFSNCQVGFSTAAPSTCTAPTNLVVTPATS